MHYKTIRAAQFIDRPNRFIAHALLDGEVVTCHVKNTGRCRELLVPGATVYLEFSSKPNRKTPCDLVAVRKGERLINMDSNAPNAVAAEWLRSGGPGFVPDMLQPERTHGDSRFDLYFEHAGRKAFMEVKGVTLEDHGVVRFPDAPTERGVKHLRGLADAVREGYDAYILFIIQMEGVRYLEPNRATHPAFAEALRTAADAGVKVLALDCRVTKNSITAGQPVEVRL